MADGVVSNTGDSQTSGAPVVSRFEVQADKTSAKITYTPGATSSAAQSLTIGKNAVVKTGGAPQDEPVAVAVVFSITNFEKPTIAAAFSGADATAPTLTFTKGSTDEAEAGLQYRIGAGAWTDMPASYAIPLANTDTALNIKPKAMPDTLTGGIQEFTVIEEPQPAITVDYVAETFSISPSANAVYKKATGNVDAAIAVATSTDYSSAVALPAGDSVVAAIKGSGSSTTDIKFPSPLARQDAVTRVNGPTSVESTVLTDPAAAAAALEGDTLITSANSNENLVGATYAVYSTANGGTIDPTVTTNRVGYGTVGADLKIPAFDGEVIYIGYPATASQYASLVATSTGGGKAYDAPIVEATGEAGGTTVTLKITNGPRYKFDETGIEAITPTIDGYAAGTISTIAFSDDSTATFTVTNGLPSDGSALKVQGLTATGFKKDDTAAGNGANKGVATAPGSGTEGEAVLDVSSDGLEINAVADAADFTLTGTGAPSITGSSEFTVEKKFISRNDSGDVTITLPNWATLAAGSVRVGTMTAAGGGVNPTGVTVGDPEPVTDADATTNKYTVTVTLQDNGTGKSTANLLISATFAPIELDVTADLEKESGNASKVYDGLTATDLKLKVKDASLTAKGHTTPANVTLNQTAVYNSKNVVDADEITVSGLSLAGTDGVYYKLSAASVNASVVGVSSIEITEASLGDPALSLGSFTTQLSLPTTVADIAGRLKDATVTINADPTLATPETVKLSDIATSVNIEGGLKAAIEASTNFITAKAAADAADVAAQVAADVADQEARFDDAIAQVLTPNEYNSPASDDGTNTDALADLALIKAVATHTFGTTGSDPSLNALEAVIDALNADSSDADAIAELEAFKAFVTTPKTADAIDDPNAVNPGDDYAGFGGIDGTNFGTPYVAAAYDANEYLKGFSNSLDLGSDLDIDLTALANVNANAALDNYDLAGAADQTLNVETSFTVTKPSLPPTTSGWQVTFEAGQHGEIVSGLTSEEVEDGKSVTAVPVVRGKGRYVFEGWVVYGTDKIVNPLDVVITEDTVFQAQFVKGYIGGDNGKFRPKDNVTRAEFLKMVVYSRPADFNAAVDYSEYIARFNDVNPNSWYANILGYAVMKGFVDGTGTNTFHPNKPVTRQEAAKMLGNAYGLKGDPNAVLDFPDANQVSAWAVEYFDALVEIGAFEGDENGMLRPKANIRRDEAAKVVAVASGFAPSPAREEQIRDEIESVYPDLAPSDWSFPVVMYGSGVIDE